MVFTFGVAFTASNYHSVISLGDFFFPFGVHPGFGRACGFFVGDTLPRILMFNKREFPGATAVFWRRLPAGSVWGTSAALFFCARNAEFLWKLLPPPLCIVVA